MSITSLLRSPNDLPLGELMLIDPLERSAIGYFELRSATPNTNTLRLYFNYEYTYKDGDLEFRRLMTEECLHRFDELLCFYRSLCAFSSFGEYYLFAIHLPFSEPFILT